MAYRVHKSENGDIIVRSKEDNFIASYKNGKWSNRIAFSGYELEDLLQVSDPKEAGAIIELAKKALQPGSVEINQKQKPVVA
ncbi:MAG: hypothetical protein C0473_00390 [Cyanobacteria bacterium DS3.002]|nr:hypothetical protein [Cyanobacteria bacterium DS3.002]MBA4050259.1 hypothetical protein [Cyanobacteria bacterium DS2.008]MBA4076862.1 hypothetical protein [Cyanobacteria bacterium PR.023]